MSFPVIRSNLKATLDVNNPPKLNDRYALLSTKDGKSILVQLTCNGKKKTLKKHYQSGCHRITLLAKFKYSDLVTAITQRMYDYHYLYQAFIQTPSTSEDFETILDRLMGVFSRNLQRFTAILPNGDISAQANSWEELRKLFRNFYHPILNQGVTLHTAPNVRVRPVCDSDLIQASLTSGLIEIAAFKVPENPDVTAWLNVWGQYDATFAYESDGVWRFITWNVYNIYINPAPPAAEGLSAPLYPQQFAVPSSNCCPNKSSSDSETSSE